MDCRGNSVGNAVTNARRSMAQTVAHKRGTMPNAVTNSHCTMTQRPCSMT